MDTELEAISNQKLERYWHELFELGIVLKGFNGIWETITGILVFFVDQATLNSWFYAFAHSELLEDPHDLFMNFAAAAFQHLLSAKMFAAAYILIHGIINVFLAVQLYRNKLWAYPAAIGAITAFIVYQIHRIILYHSVVLAAITIFDMFLIILIWHEYNRRKHFSM